MKPSLLYLIGFSILMIACRTNNIKPVSRNLVDGLSTHDTLPPKEYIFPDDWLGQWSGELKIYKTEGLKQTVPMSLDLSETDSIGIYTWAIIYGKDSTAQRRNYQLRVVDKLKGHYLIDEKNGILLDAYHIHNELNSIFEVMGNTLMTSYKIEEDEIVFSVKVFPSKEIRISGDTLIDNQEIPKVSSFEYTVNQVARLQKKCLVE